MNVSWVYRFVIFSLFVAYLMFVHILYRGMRVASDNQDFKSVIKHGTSLIGSEGESYRPDVEHSFLFHVNKWFDRFGYDTKLGYDFDSMEGFKNKGSEAPPVLVRLLISLLAGFRVFIFPFTFEE